MNMAEPINPDGINPHDERRSGELHCPHCESIGIRRSSREVAITFREIFYVCSNPLCGHTWKGSLSYDYGLSPSAIPDPAVKLPMRTVNRDDVIAARAANQPPDPNQPGLFDH